MHTFHTRLKFTASSVLFYRFKNKKLSWSAASFCKNLSSIGLMFLWLSTESPPTNIHFNYLKPKDIRVELASVQSYTAVEPVQGIHTESWCLSPFVFQKNGYNIIVKRSAAIQFGSSSKEYMHIKQWQTHFLLKTQFLLPHWSTICFITKKYTFNLINYRALATMKHEWRAIPCTLPPSSLWKADHRGHRNHGQTYQAEKDEKHAL